MFQRSGFCSNPGIYVNIFTSRSVSMHLHLHLHLDIWLYLYIYVYTYKHTHIYAASYYLYLGWQPHLKVPGVPRPSHQSEAPASSETLALAWAREEA